LQDTPVENSSSINMTLNENIKMNAQKPDEEKEFFIGIEYLEQKNSGFDN
jgi:hypothetical protein